MSIKYKVVEKSNPQNRTETKFYVQPIRKGTIGRSKLEEALIRETSLSKADIRGVLVTLSDLVADYLLEGYNVKLEDIGTLSPRVKSAGTETAEEVSAKNVTHISVGFRAATALAEKVSKTKFEKE